MLSPFQPLLQLVLIAVSPWGRPQAVDARAGGGSSSARAASASSDSIGHSLPPAPLDRHTAEPVTLASEYAQQEVPLWEPVDRFRVLARDRQGTLWVSLNSISNQLPPPPDRRGPIGCDCPNFDGHRGSRYGRMQNANLKVWMADDYDGARPFAPYIPDLFCGLGPCFARTYRSALAQWDPEWVVPHEDGVQISPSQRAVFLALSRTDDAARKALRLEARPDVPAPHSARTSSDLHEQYGHWVAHRMETRGRVLERLLKNDQWREFQDKFHSLWIDMRDAGYFARPPIGTLVQDTPALVGKILEFQRAGVPVYYRWRAEFDDSKKFPHLAALRPPREAESTPRLRATEVVAAPSRPRVTEVATTPTRSRAAREFTLPAKSVLWSPARRPAPDNTYAVHDAPPPTHSHQASSPSSEAEPKRVKFDDSPAVARVPADMGDFEDEAFWDQASEYLDRQEESGAAPPKLLARITEPATDSEDGDGSASESSSTTISSTGTRPDSAPFVFIPPPLTTRVENDKPYRSLVQGRVADNLLTGAGKSVSRRAGAGSYRVIAEDKAPRSFEERITVNPGQVELRLFILETEVAEKFVKEYIRQHPSATILEIARFLLDRKMPFNLAFPLRGIDTRHQTFPSPLYESFVITSDLSLPNAYSRWFEGGRAMLSVERIRRTVAARGGILARIAKLMGLDTNFRRFPSAFVCTSGGPNLVSVEPRTNTFYYDDWLSREEVNILLGVMVTHDATRSIMPPLEMFNTFYAGAWGRVYEDWFGARLAELNRSLKTVVWLKNIIATFDPSSLLAPRSLPAVTTAREELRVVSRVQSALHCRSALRLSGWFKLGSGYTSGRALSLAFGNVDPSSP